MYVYSILYVILCSNVLKGVVSETCLDVRHVNYTIKCHFDVCKIPGQFCDYSDEDFPRCANCDQDKCNEANIPGECTIPCMQYRHGLVNLTKIIDKCKEDDTLWKKDFVAKTLLGFVVLLIIIIFPMVYILWSQRRLSNQERNKEQEMKSPIAQPEEEGQGTRLTKRRWPPHTVLLTYQRRLVNNDEILIKNSSIRLLVSAVFTERYIK